VHLKTDRELPV